eukprot:CAMPEP_0117424006 /NCGR_PEP_ID=MMETSP0758-20121206/4515_1 /TAXON_ID=63605 /ORGANISM="Percolomonas cosmopolitus, Strain AE-1 (ATCC 50343)" /LENGTH=138 /DNA_ID=CAMNT_0005207533 /DNA_START=219 /DNA_END=635 /DNA_ORIENTATION=-
MSDDEQEEEEDDEEEEEEDELQDTMKESEENNEKEETITCFAIVSLVHQNSPADKAGLKVGDFVYAFGDLNAQHIQAFGMSALVQTVQQSLNLSIPLKILRMTSPMSLSLVPQPWEGRGYLGCKLDLTTKVVTLQKTT